MKSIEELNALKLRIEEVTQELASLSDDEMKQIYGGTITPVEPESIDRGAVVTRAQQALGTPYKWGAVGPDGYDCSGLVSYCLTGQHCRIGTTSTFMGWPRVSNPEPGDICVSSTHCGIYIGPGTMIHAPTFGSVVSVASIQGDMIIVRSS